MGLGVGVEATRSGPVPAGPVSLRFGPSTAHLGVELTEGEGLGPKSHLVPVLT